MLKITLTIANHNGYKLLTDLPREGKSKSPSRNKNKSLYQSEVDIQVADVFPIHVFTMTETQEGNCTLLRMQEETEFILPYFHT
jgi:hypothetical protein